MPESGNIFKTKKTLTANRFLNIGRSCFFSGQSRKSGNPAESSFSVPFRRGCPFQTCRKRLLIPGSKQKTYLFLRQTRAHILVATHGKLLCRAANLSHLPVLPYENSAYALSGISHRIKDFPSIFFLSFYFICGLTFRRHGNIK